MPLQFELSHRTFLALVCGIIGIIALVLIFIFLPSATITLYPAQEHRSVTQEITLATDTTQPDFVRFVLPAKVVETELTDTKTIQRTGTQASEDFAKGTVTIHNELNEEQPLLPKTHLRHEASGIQFLTDTAVRIPPQGEVQVSVTAEVVGASGNVPAGKFIIDKLPAALQTAVFAESTTPFAGGLVTEGAITEQEIAAAKEELGRALQERATSELTLKSGGAAINPELVHIETLADESSAAPGSRAVSFEVRKHIRARAFMTAESDLLSLTLLALRSSTASEEEFVAYGPETFTADILRADFERGQARVTGSLTGTFAKKIEPSILSRESIAGLGIEETKEYFENFPAVGRAEVTLSPFWVRSIPTRSSAVTINITQP